MRGKKYFNDNWHSRSYFQSPIHNPHLHPSPHTLYFISYNFLPPSPTPSLSFFSVPPHHRCLYFLSFILPLAPFNLNYIMVSSYFFYKYHDLFLLIFWMRVGDS